MMHNEEYARKVSPFIKTEYFPDRVESVITDEILKFFNKYNKVPTKEILSIEVGNRRDINDEQHIEVQSYIGELNFEEELNNEWLVERTEQFCKDKALINAIYDAISIIDGKDKARDAGYIPTLLSDALAVSFDTNIGHDYLDDAELRYEFYHRKENKIPFHIDLFNKITNGGLTPKTLNVFLAGTGVGKSLLMCDLAAHWLEAGYDVLYFTMEMSEEKISERIDANLFNVDIGELKYLDKNTFFRKVEKIKSNTSGKLIVKEFPTGSAHVGHFRAVIEELKIKKKFKPQIIIVDYLNICASSRLKHGSNVNTYSYIKSIAEELRGLGVEYDVPVISATQTNRDGLDASDVSMNNTSESIGLPQTVDLFLALISSEELEELGQIMVKQLKNRYNDLNFYKRFVVGIEKSKMRLYNVEASAQEDITDKGRHTDKWSHDDQDDKPLFDKSTFSRGGDTSGWKF